VVFNKRIACRTLLAFFAIASGQGCTAILTSDRSEMQLATSRNPTRLALPSVTIQVVPQNGKVIGMVGPLVPIFPFWYSEAKDKFWFLISLSPINGEISFDPRRVAIKTEQGGSFHVARYGGPLRRGHSRQP
jgi:hypothetical protein